MYSTVFIFSSLTLINYLKLMPTIASNDYYDVTNSSDSSEEIVGSDRRSDNSYFVPYMPLDEEGAEAQDRISDFHEAPVSDQKAVEEAIDQVLPTQVYSKDDVKAGEMLREVSMGDPMAHKEEQDKEELEKYVGKFLVDYLMSKLKNAKERITADFLS